MNRKPLLSPDLVVILCGVAAALHIGKLPPALPVLREALGISLLEAGFLLSLVQFAGMTTAVVLSLATDGLGLRRSILLGLAILTAASALGGMAHSAGPLLWLRAAEGFGFLLVSLSAPSLIRALVPPQRLSLSLGLWGAYMPLGTALALLCGPWVMIWLGWPGWWWSLAALSAVMALYLVASVPPDAARCAAAAAPSRAASGQPWRRLGQTLSAGGPWLVALTFAMYAAQWLAVIGFLPSVYDQAGISGPAAGALTALAALCNVVGNVASGRLVHRGARPQQLLHVAFAAMALGTFIAFSLPDEQVLLRYLGVMMFSGVGGMIPATLFMLAVKLAPGEHTVSTTIGWMQQFASLGQFVGAPLVAWVAGFAGGWQWTWTVTCAACAVGALLVSRMPQR